MVRIALVLPLVLLISAGLLGCGVPPPEAQYTASPNTGYIPIEVQFTDLSEGDIDTWEWDFNGDGITDSTLQNPTYTYRRDGLYSVTLTIAGPYCEDTLTKTNYIQITGCKP
jgi:PKD repeat protein